MQGKRDIRFPTLAGITILLLAIVSGVILVKSKQIFRIGATPDMLPKDVRISNISQDSFTVSWTTNKETKGWIKYGTSLSNPDQTGLNNEMEEGNIHWVNVENLQSDTKYHLKIVSDGYEFDYNGIPWQTETIKNTSTVPDSVLATGKILSESGTPVINALVYLTAGGGSTLSTLSDNNGDWLITMSQSWDSTLSSFLNIEKDTLLEILVQAEPDKTALAQIYAEAANPVPYIHIGETHNFKSVSPPQSANAPLATIEIPQSDINRSKPQSQENSEVKINYPSPNEIVLTTKFFIVGSSPPNKVINLSLEPVGTTKRVQSNNDGYWEMSPTERLPSGNYQIFASWLDGDRKLQEVATSFIINASQ